MVADSLTVTDNRTGKTYEVPITHGAIRAMDLRQIKTSSEDFGLLSYDPAFMNTASTISRITEIDGDRGILRYRGYPIEELAERSNYLEVAYLLLHGELHAQQDGRLGLPDHPPHLDPREHQEVHGRLPSRRPPDGHAGVDGGGAVHVLSRGQGRRPGDPQAADHPAHRQDADAGGVRIPSQPGHALRVPRQRLELRGQLPEHAVQDDRGQVRAQPGHRAGGRRAFHAARRPRAELLDQRGAQRGLVAGGSLLGDGRRHRG